MNLKSLFNDPRWLSLIKLEQHLLASFRKREKLLNVLSLSAEDFQKHHAYLHGADEAINQIWRERDAAIASVPKDIGEDHE